MRWQGESGKGWKRFNGPFWSLSYEFWYYMFFAAFVYWKGSKRILALVGAMLIAGPMILSAFPIWLSGTLVYAALTRNQGMQSSKGWALWLGSFVAALAFSAFDLHQVFTGRFPEAAAAAKWGLILCRSVMQSG